jgi:hypothetical protein
MITWSPASATSWNDECESTSTGPTRGAMSKVLYKHEYNNLYRAVADGLPVRFLIVNSVIYKSHKWIFACHYLFAVVGRPFVRVMQSFG